MEQERPFTEGDAPEKQPSPRIGGSRRHEPRSIVARAATLLAVLAGCSTHPFDAEPVSQPAIFANDDRRDWREVDSDLASFGQRHVGVMTYDVLLRTRGTTPRRANFVTTLYGESLGLCDDQPFLCQPRLGECSGTLIDGNLFVTAGHCLGIPTPASAPTTEEREELVERLQDWCDAALVVFNWRELDREPPPSNLPAGETGGEVPTIVTERDVYHCHEVLVHQNDPRARETSTDVTIFTLKRDADASSSQPVVAPYGPALVMENPRRPPPVSVGALVEGIGFPAGLPMKFKSSSILAGGDDIRVRTHMDILGGDSGGGLFLDRRHFAVASTSALLCPPGTRRAAGHYCARASGCLVEMQGAADPRIASVYSLTWRAIDALCGGDGSGPGITAPPPFTTRSTPYPSYLCGTAPPVAPEPYVPSPEEPEPVEPEPTAPPGARDADDPVGAVGCSVDGNARGVGISFVVLLGMLVRRRRSDGAMLASLCILGAACAGSKAEPDDDREETPPEVRDAGTRDPELTADDTELQHVVSYVGLPRSRDAVGLDLDDDGAIDSALGEVVALFDDLGVSLSRSLNRATRDGRLRFLLVTTRERGIVDLTIYTGLREPLDLSGGGVYSVDTDTPPIRFTGTSTSEDGFAVGTESFVLRIPLLEGVRPIELPMNAARFEGDVREPFFEGVLAGAVPERALRAGVFVPLSDLFDLLLRSDPGCPSACESAGLGVALSMMDANDDGSLSVAELEGFPPLAARLTPDLDTDLDGVADALSVGVRIEAVEAGFTPSTRATSGGSPKSLLCFDECSDATDCAACNGRSECGWCASERLCVTRSRRASCEMDGGTWVDRITQCEDCTARATCGECVGRNAFCGWCPGMGCVNDSAVAATACGADYRRFADGCE